MGDELDRRGFEVQCGGGEAGECGDEAILERGAIGLGPGRSVKLLLHGAVAVIKGPFAAALLERSIERRAWKRAAGAGVPILSGERRLGFNPGPTENGVHLAKDYEYAGAMVPGKAER